MKDVTEGENTTITLKCGNTIHCLESTKTIRGRMAKGRMVEEKFASHMMGKYSFKEGLEGIESEYNKIATKGDITMLANEIMKLRNKLE